MTDQFSIHLKGKDGIDRLADSLEGHMKVDRQGDIVHLKTLEGQDFRGNAWAYETADALAGMVGGDTQVSVTASQGTGVPSHPVDRLAMERHYIMTTGRTSSRHETLREALFQTGSSRLHRDRPWRVLVYDGREFKGRRVVRTGEVPMIPTTQYRDVTLRAAPLYPSGPFGIWLRSQIERIMDIPEDSLSCRQHGSDRFDHTTWVLRFAGDGDLVGRNLSEEIADLIESGAVHGINREFDIEVW